MIPIRPRTRVAAVLACYNRRERTLACLRSLYEGTEPDIALSVVVVDDNSSDETAAAVGGAFPAARVVEGAGDLYWCGGMRCGLSHAAAMDPDYFLWLNDDVELLAGALGRLVDTAEDLSRRLSQPAIVVGSTCDPASGEITYGGVVRNSRWSMSYRLVAPQQEPVRCETFNGNVVLVPRAAALKLGGLSEAFSHAAGDFDYGLRALETGVTSWVTAGFVGVCAGHAITGSVLDRKLSLRVRRKLMVRPGGPTLVREWLIFTRRHAGLVWPLLWARTLVRVLCPNLWLWLRQQDG